MKHQIWSGLTAILLAPALGATSPSHAEQPQTVSFGPNQSVQDQDIVAKIQPHELAGRSAATIYVRNIPVLTFLGSEMPKAEDAAFSQRISSSVATPTQLNPLERATQIATVLNQLSGADFDAHQIGVKWDSGKDRYVVFLHEETLVAIDETTLLPDTTQNPAEDALQIANRLRRQLGGAPPLTEIEGRPQPAPAPQAVEVVATRSSGITYDGMASWYGPGFHGNLSASGERFNQYDLTAAHRSLPFGTRVRVTNLDNGRSVVVRINDRGPFVGNRIIDLSMGAASEIGMMSSGVAPVEVEVLQ